jgi:hypothetical protein
MSMRDGIFTTVAVALSGVAVAGLLATDVYSQAAGAEARGLKALSSQVEMRCDACAEERAGRLAVVPEGERQ